MSGSLRSDGLTDAEGDVMDALIEATAAFDALPSEHPDEATEFYAAIHRLQDLLAVRAMRRIYPEGWVTFAGD